MLKVNPTVLASTLFYAAKAVLFGLVSELDVPGSQLSWQAHFYSSRRRYLYQHADVSPPQILHETTFPPLRLNDLKNALVYKLGQVRPEYGGGWKNQNLEFS
ncbi:hypothetical protein BDN72DRAFT_900843 [Pluteus cervinus]|uniref:Uncharacterized protein n=1 Tax=Pluteus cervinus TaxID=181527 RepID=A0ACD3AHX0_9AGAR|nr:hypothetical protein BDN72DRAFT_900843 [Pluteus cervinus]